MNAVSGTGAQAPVPLSGRRALVTGASSGIGRATALRLARDGAAVAVNHIADQAAEAASAVAEIEQRGGRAVPVEADVAAEDQVREMFGRAQEALDGPVDLLVNNAGIETSAGLADLALEDWEKVLAVNLTGPFLCSRELVRRLPEPAPGTIVMVSSVHEVIPWRTFAHYCASKGGLKLFAQTIAVELAPRIRVASVAPGAILTPINEELIEDPRKRQEQEDQIPLGRLGEPEEIAGAISWLAGPEAEYVSGATLFVDGGMTLYPTFV